MLPSEQENQKRNEYYNESYYFSSALKLNVYVFPDNHPQLGTFWEPLAQVSKLAN